MGSAASVQANASLPVTQVMKSASPNSIQTSHLLAQISILKEMVESEKKHCQELMQSKEELRSQLKQAQKDEEFGKNQIFQTKEQLSDLSKKFEDIQRREENLLKQHHTFPSDALSSMSNHPTIRYELNDQTDIQNSLQSALSVQRLIGANPHEINMKIVDLFIQRQNKDFVSRVFEDNCKRLVNGKKGVGSEEIKNALQQLGLNHQSLGFDSMENMVSELDVDTDTLINYEEFVHFLQRPSKIEGWTSSIPWSQMVATVINSTEEMANGKDPLHRLALLSGDEEKLANIFRGINYGIQILLTKHIQELKRALAELDSTSATRNSHRNRGSESGNSWTKFSSTSAMPFGIVSNFYEGLSSRVGEVLIY
jgi:hypothetical protein